MGEFTHLHLHTAYSLLDGAIRLPDLFQRCREFGMDAVAMTDHGNLFGVVDFYKRAKDAGVKPIFGCETYVAGNDRFNRQSRTNHHLILLARDQEGYSNLRYLNSMGFLEGFYYHPRIDKPLLVITAKADHIAPRPGTMPLFDLVSSDDVTHLDRPGGHIGLMAGSSAHEEIWPDIADWLEQRSAK